MTTPSADVTFNVVAQKASAQMDAFVSMMKRRMKELKDETAKVNRQATGGGVGSGGTTFSGWVSDLIKAKGALMALAAPGNALRTVFEMVKQEIQQIMQLAESARTKQVPFQALLSVMGKSVPAGEATQDILPVLEDMILKSKIGDKAALTRIIMEAGSVGAGVPYTEKARTAIAVAEQNMDLMMTNPVALEQMAAQAILGNQLFGNRGSTTEAQMQLMYKGITSSRVNDTRLYAENIMGAGASGLKNAFDMSQIDSLALLNSMTNVMQDATGDLAPTAAFSLMNALQKGEQRFGFKLPADLRGKLEFIQGDDPRAAEFRKFALGAYLEGFDLTDDERMMLSDANLNKELAMNLPGSRMKNIHAVSGLLQPKGTHEQVGGAKEQLTVGYAELGALPGKTDAQVYQDMANEWSKTTREIAALGVTEAMNRANAAAGGAGSALTSNKAQELMGYYYSDQEGGHQNFLKSVAGAPALRQRLVGPAHFLTSGSDEMSWKEAIRDDYDWAFNVVTPKNMRDPAAMRQWVPGGLSDAEAAQFGVDRGTQIKINAVLTAMKTLTDQITRLAEQQERDAAKPKEVKVVNQPPAQPRKPAAEGLKN